MRLLERDAHATYMWVMHRLVEKSKEAAVPPWGNFLAEERVTVLV